MHGRTRIPAARGPRATAAAAFRGAGVAGPPGWAVVVAAGALLGLAGCTGGDGPGDGAPGAGAISLPGEVAPAATGEPARFKGVMTVEGRPELALCDGRILPLDGPAAMELVELHAELTPGAEPLEGLFVDVLGEVRDPGDGPWLDALEVRRAAYEGWGCARDESALVLEASGTEPFWSLTVVEGTATWRTPESLETLAHDGAFPMPRGGWMLEGLDAGGEVRLRAEFYQEPCRNAMSGAFSHLTALVTQDGTEYRGCAFWGPESGPTL